MEIASRKGYQLLVLFNSISGRLGNVKIVDEYKAVTNLRPSKGKSARRTVHVSRSGI